MKWRCVSLLVSVTLLQSIALPADAPVLTAEQREVWKASQSLLDAFNHRDVNAFGSATADDYIGSTDDAVYVTKASLLNRLVTRPPEYEQRHDVRDVRVRVDGDTGVVNYLLTVSKQGFGKTTLVFQFRRTEFFQKKNGTWLAIAGHESNLTVNLRKPVAADPKTFKDYVGEYDFRPGFPDTYSVVGDRLIDEWKGTKQEALPMGKDSFFTRDDLGWVTFVRDSQGRVTGYVYYLPDGQEVAVKKIR